MQLISGHKLQNGKYRIQEKIGQGGFGITYRAFWIMTAQGPMGAIETEIQVVIKEFFWSKYCNRDPDGYSVSISSAEGKEMMTQFKSKLKKEGTIISRLSHPNIVRILDIFEENNTAYLVMQHIDGESLGEMIEKRGKMDEPAVLKYTQQLCSALTEIHGKHILHLDIKPSNVLIDKNDNVQLIDFGISKQYNESAQETSNTPLCVSGGYSPVEQYGTLKSFSPPTDIYATGATLYKMLTGKTPIEATARNQFDLEPVTCFNPDISKKTEEAVAKAMSEKIRDRFQTAEALWQALNQAEEVIEVEEVHEKESVDVAMIYSPQNDREGHAQIAEITLVDAPPSSKPQEPLEPPITKTKRKPWPPYLKYIFAAVVLVLLAVVGLRMYQPKWEQNRTIRTQLKRERDSIDQVNQINEQKRFDSIVKANEQKLQDSISREMQQKRIDSMARATQFKRQQDSISRVNQAKQEEERQRKEQQAADLLRQANNTFGNNSLGAARYEQSFQLYKQAKDLGGNVTDGYRNFHSLAKLLIESGSGYDANVKKILLYAQQLSNTQEVRDLLAKCD